MKEMILILLVISKSVTVAKYIGSQMGNHSLAYNRLHRLHVINRVTRFLRIWIFELLDLVLVCPDNSNSIVLSYKRKAAPNSIVYISLGD